MTDEGNIEYWYCNACDRYYIRQDGLVEIEKSQTVIAKLKDTTPQDMEGAVIYLASKASDYVNGFTLAVDGGWLAR